MTVQIQEAQYVDLLKKIPQFEINNGCSLFRKHWIKRPMCIGLIGLTGEGKSASASVIALIDDLLEGRPVWSNLDLHADINIPDIVAQKYGLPNGGTVSYESFPLDRKKLLKFDPEYNNGTLLIDEINIEYAEALRTMSNVNLWFNEVDQQRRHLGLTIYYTVIHEMWVDNRLRSMTDVFIKCEDPALDPAGLMKHTPEGLQVKWTIYPMSRMLTGQSYYETKQPLPPRYLQLRPFWGLFDTLKSQSKGGAKYTFKFDDDGMESNMEMTTNEIIEQERKEWAWLDESLTYIVEELQDEGENRISQYDLLNRLEVPKYMRSAVLDELKYRLKVRSSGGILFFHLPEANLKRPSSVGAKSL